ncbi:DNA cytosine methyltransferase [Alphaproteobacteria bacterium]|nr:DNA cytosine methyltransferase [Alphaproteobacteria bacterium]
MAKHGKLKAYTLFAGGGGLHLGLEKAGIQVLVASDIDEHAESTHKLNWPRLPFIRKDCRELNSDELLASAGGVRPNIMAGGPPCQGFSTIGDKLSSDPRNDLFSSFLRLADNLQPEVILIENVKSISTMYEGRFASWIKKRLHEMGYNVHFKVLNAADYGTPQFRQRAIFVGTRFDSEFNFPSATHGPNTKNCFITVGDAISDLKTKGEEIPNHVNLNHSETVVARYRLIPQGGRLPPPEELPPEIRRKNFGNTYKRLDPKMPALTMVPGNNAFPVHPTLHRSLTPREAARIQSFPDNFIFTGDRRTQCILVGNAVPPLLGEALGHSILSHAKKAKFEIIGETNKLNDAEPGSIFRYRAKKGYNFVDLFSGAGGFTIGFQKAGMEPLIGADYNKNAAETHRQNYPYTPFLEGDLSNPDIQSELFDNLPKDVFCVVGGPPCQGFSIFGKRRFVNTKGYQPWDDERNALVFSFVNIVHKIKPKWFVMENVAGLSSLDNGKFLEALINEFKAIGFHNVEYKLLNAANYGVPQLRKRLVIIGNRTGHIIPWPKRKYFENPKDWQKPFRVVGEVLTDLSTDASLQKYKNHVPMKHKPLLVERYRYIPEGGKLDVDALPEHLKSGYRTSKVKNYSHIFKRLHRNKPSFTMVPGHNAFPIHPWLNRALTVREAARIQTFPDEIEFYGSRQEQCIQVGNAFPPLLAELIANNLIKSDKNHWYKGKVPASAYYSLVEKIDITDEDDDTKKVVSSGEKS